MYECFSQLPVLHSFGVRLFDLFWRTNYHQNNEWEFHFIRHGSMTLECNGKAYEAGKGDIVFIPPNTKHKDKFDPGQDFEVFMASFSWSGADEKLQELLPSPVIKGLNASRRGQIRQCCDALYLDVHRDSSYDVLLSRTIFHTLLLTVLKAIDEQQNKKVIEDSLSATSRKKLWLIQEVKAYIHKNYQQQINLEDLALSLGVSQYHLSRVFNAESGFSLPEYLTLVRMKHAKTLLSEGTQNISEIAYAVGYEDSSYFSKVFRKHFGCSPSVKVLSNPKKRI